MRYDQYDEVTSPPEGAELLLNDPTDTSGGTQPHGTLKRIAPGNLVPGSGGSVDGGSAGSTYTSDQVIDGGGA